MTTFQISMISMALAFSVTANAASTCIQNAAEHAEKNASLPAFVQKLPAMLVTDGFLVTAGLKIRIAGNKLKLEGSVWKPGEVLKDDCYISKACYDGETLKVTLENGKSYEAKVKNEESVSIQGITFDKSSESKFAGVIDKIQKAQAKKAENAKSTSGEQPGVQ